ncbi:MAG: hypothetical protein WBK67_00555 [Minisyncoccales bacterium]
MTPYKFALYLICYLVAGIITAYVVFDATARTQAQREASFIAKADSTRVGQSVRLGNGTYLKMSEVK